MNWIKEKAKIRENPKNIWHEAKCFGVWLKLWA